MNRLDLLSTLNYFERTVTNQRKSYRLKRIYFKRCQVASIQHKCVRHSGILYISERVKCIKKISDVRRSKPQELLTLKKHIFNQD